MSRLGSWGVSRAVGGAQALGSQVGHVPPDDVAHVGVAQLGGDIGGEAFAHGEDRLVEVEHDAGERASNRWASRPMTTAAMTNTSAAAATTMRTVTAPPLGDSRG